MQGTSLETSRHGLVLDVDVPQASGKYPPHLPVTECTSSPCAPTGMLTTCWSEDSFLAGAYLRITNAIFRQRGETRIQKAVGITLCV